jgi:hypothetical protein
MKGVEERQDENVKKIYVPTSEHSDRGGGNKHAHHQTLTSTECPGCHEKLLSSLIGRKMLSVDKLLKMPGTGAKEKQELRRPIAPGCPGTTCADRESRPLRVAAKPATTPPHMRVFNMHGYCLVGLVLNNAGFHRSHADPDAFSPVFLQPGVDSQQYSCLLRQPDRAGFVRYCPLQLDR